MLVDIKNKLLRDAITNLKIVGKLTISERRELSTYDTSSPFADILQEFKEVTKPTQIKIPKHGITHHIVIVGPPVADCPERG